MFTSIPLRQRLALARHLVPRYWRINVRVEIYVTDTLPDVSKKNTARKRDTIITVRDMSFAGKCLPRGLWASTFAPATVQHGVKSLMHIYVLRFLRRVACRQNCQQLGLTKTVGQVEHATLLGKSRESTKMLYGTVRRPQTREI